jgi:sulfur carrier protein ThiS
MRYVTLVQVPGPGASSVEVAEDTTVAQFVADNNLSGKTIIVDGEGISPDNYGTATLNSATEIFATAAVKGN